MDSTDEDSYYVMGNIYFYQNRYDSAKWLYTETIRHRPAYGAAYGMLGNIYSTEKKYDSAKCCFSRQLQLNPTDNSAAYNMACVYSLTNTPDSALFFYKKALGTGWVDFDHIAADTDLDHIRKLPEFIAITEEFRKKYLNGK